MGHPYSIVLSIKLNFGFLGNKERVSKNLSFDSYVGKLVKNKTLLFSSKVSHATKCFDIMQSDL